MVSKNTYAGSRGSNLRGPEASQNVATIDPELEHDNADQAVQDFREKGYTDCRCLRCGGKFLFDDAEVAYKIWCENGDFDMTARGI